MFGRLAALRHRRAPSDDAGFTLVEVIVSIALVTIVMTALAAFYISASSNADAQSARQSAVQVATDAISQARSLKAKPSNGSLVSGLLVGRDATSTRTQWDAGTSSTANSGAYPGVDAYLDNLNQAVGTSGTAALPTTPQPISLNGTTFNRNWFLGWCWLTDAGTCKKSADTNPSSWLQVVVDVQWKNSACDNNLCSYITSTLISTDDDPTFDGTQNATRPNITQPVNQTVAYNATVNLPIAYSGGTAPFYWVATGLPPGLSITYPTVTTVAIAGTPTTAGTYTTTIQVTDGFGYIDSKQFTWTINGPTLNTIANQTNTAGDPSVTVAASVATASPRGGTNGPYTWSATGLPPGVGISGTGASASITGSPTDAGTYNVTVKFVDTNKYVGSTGFTWTVNGPTITAAAKSSVAGTADSAPLKVTGGVAPYDWTASGLPPGVTLTDSSGTNATLSGTPTQAGSYTVTAKVTDARGNTATKQFSWSVAVGITVVNAPSCSATSPYTCTAKLRAIGGTSSYNWNNSGSYSMATAADTMTLTFTKSAAGTYTVTVYSSDAGKYSNSTTLSFKAGP